MREVDPTPRTSHVTPPFWELSTLAAAIGRWGLARLSALHNAPGCGATRDRGMAQSHAPPHAKIPGEQQHTQAVLLLLYRVSLSRGCGVRAGSRPSLSQVGDQLPAYPLSFLEQGSTVVLPAAWDLAPRLRFGESVCTPVAPPLEPSLCSQLPTPLWWRSRSPALPTAHLRPPLPWHALYVLYYVYASACPVCGMGACGVCVVSGCECSLRVGSVGLPRLVAGCASVRAWACPYQRLEKGGGHGL